MGNDFHIDKVTECIEEVSTGKIFDTDILRVTREDLKAVLKKNGWNFPWKSYVKLEERHVYKLVKLKDPAQEIQGLLSFQIMSDFIEMHHVENAPHNIGSKKQYAGVCANMVAFACKVSFDLKFEGFVSFLAKTALIGHYKNTLGATQVFNTARMIIYPEAAGILVNSYYKNYLGGH
jgi:hypothetical protein